MWRDHWRFSQKEKTQQSPGQQRGGQLMPTRQRADNDAICVYVESACALYKCAVCMCTDWDFMAAVLPRGPAPGIMALPLCCMGPKAETFKRN